MRPRLPVRHLAPGDPSHGFADLPDVLGAGAAASTRGVQEARFRELLQELAGGRRLLVVAAEGVGQPGVRVADHVDGRHP